MSWKGQYQKKRTKMVIVLMNVELGGKILKEFSGLKAKTYSYIIYDGSEDKKQKVQKSVSWKERLTLKSMKTVQNKLKLKIII